jgi:hypothetical protein
MEGLGAPSGGFTKVTIKTKLLNFFARKETKTKQVWPWLHQMDAYMEMQCLEIDKEHIHFA